MAAREALQAMIREAAEREVAFVACAQPRAWRPREADPETRDEASLPLPNSHAYNVWEFASGDPRQAVFE
jgi:hypothetical protein